MVSLTTVFTGIINGVKILWGLMGIFGSFDIIVNNVECENVEEQNNYPTEFLNSPTPTGMPPHLLHFKVCTIVLILRNLNTKQGLFNGTRMVILRMCSHVLQAQILRGTNVEHTVLVYQPSLHSEEVSVSNKLAFAMTIKRVKAKPLLERVSCYKSLVFTHGQLYVTFPRVQTLDSIHVKLNPRISNIVANAILPRYG
ncbi:hypothetical protein LAZ67_13000006 [Cordylochernes scorpioides]|uniref:DNA helicase Pif1-like 2B domain-containing protein n=1 Tax=Cordylochernes scorpioides TaxID=51811 RepID=A0ABY6L3C9_9ARAC|nr:hypothetical protein LAZ67_13000006 [Cordylochernes scorpioides]